MINSLINVIVLYLKSVSLEAYSGGLATTDKYIKVGYHIKARHNTDIFVLLGYVYVRDNIKVVILNGGDAIQTETALEDMNLDRIAKSFIEIRDICLSKGSSMKHHLENKPC